MDVKKGDKIMSKLPISIYSLDEINFGDSTPLGIGEDDKFYGIEVHSGLFKTCTVIQIIGILKEIIKSIKKLKSMV